MPEDDETLEPAGEEYHDFVLAVFARSPEDAERYGELLNDHDIPTIVGAEQLPASDEEDAPEGHSGITRGVPVLVPDALLDEASEIIADRENLAAFGLGQEDEEEEEDEDDEAFGLTEPAEGDLKHAFDEEDEEEEEEGLYGFDDEEDLEDEDDEP